MYIVERGSHPVLSITTTYLALQFTKPRSHHPHLYLVGVLGINLASTIHIFVSIFSFFLSLYTSSLQSNLITTSVSKPQRCKIKANSPSSLLIQPSRPVRNLLLGARIDVISSFLGSCCECYIYIINIYPLTSSLLRSHPSSFPLSFVKRMWINRQSIPLSP